MTVQFLAAWNGYEQYQTATLSSAEEARLVSAGICRTYFAGQDGRSLAAVVQDPVSGAQFAGQSSVSGVVTLDYLNAARAAIPASVSRGSAPVRRFKAGTDLAAGVSANALTAVADESKWGRESNSLKVTTSAASNAYLVKNFSTAVQDWTGVTEFGFLIYSDRELPSNATISFSYSNDQTWTNYKQFTMPLGSAGTRDGKQYIKVRVDQATTNFGPFAGAGTDGTGWSTNGTGATLNNNMQWIRLDFGNLVGIPIWVEGVYTGGGARPSVALYFDNWWDLNPGASYVKHSQYIKPILDAYGWKCGITVPLDAIGGANPTSLAGMRALYDEGHDVILNDVTDAGFITQGISAAQCAVQVDATKRALASYGFSRGNNIWVLNQNESTMAQRAALAAAGVLYARGGTAERRFQHWEMGVENLLCAGSSGLDAVTSTKIKALWQRVIDYKAHADAYWHKFNVGGTIDGARPGTSLTSWVEEFADSMADLRTKELAGSIDVLSPSQALTRRLSYGSLYQAA